MSESFFEENYPNPVQVVRESRDKLEPDSTVLRANGYDS
mgnify:CR=1 FL=1